MLDRRVAFRRLTQFSVMAFILWVAMGGAWRNYKIAHNNGRLVELMEGPVWGALYRANENLLSAWDEPYRASFDFLGLPWAATMFGLETVDPLLAATHVLASGAPRWEVVVAALVPLLLAAVLGKVFCSHLCPMRLMFEFGQLVRAGLLRLGVPLPHRRAPARLGGWLLLGGLVASISAGASAWIVLLPYVSLGAGLHLAITAGAAAGGALLAIVVGWWLADVLVAPGMFCRDLCPQGFLLENVGRFSLLRLTAKEKPACPPRCRACRAACPYGLFPGRGDHRPACDACGGCIGACPEKKLQRRFVLPIVAGVAVLFAAQTADAHHNKGLPHYGYYENYPQVPTQEKVIVDGRWELGATIFNFQGYQARRTSDTPDDVKIFAYLYDLERDEPYQGPVKFEVLHGGTVVASFERDGVDDELVYTSRQALPESGFYHLVAHVPDPERAAEVRLPFDIDLGDSGPGWGFAMFGAIPFAVMLGLAFFGGGSRGRKKLVRDRARAGRGAKAPGENSARADSGRPRTLDV